MSTTTGYRYNKPRSKTRNTVPTLTDQSAAKETDRNIIVQRYLQHGQVPTGKQPIYGDFSEFPTDLAGFLAQARSIQRLRGQLPVELQSLSINELLNMTTDELAAKLKKPEPEPATTPTAATTETK